MFSNEQMPGLPEDLSLSSKDVGPSAGLRSSGLLNGVPSWLMNPGRKETVLSFWQGTVAVSPVNKASAPARS